MEVFLSVDEVRNLLGVSDRAVRKQISAKKYVTQQVPTKGGGKGGLKYEIALCSLPQTAQDKYLAEQAKRAVARLNEQANLEDIPQAEQALKDYAEQQKHRQHSKEDGLRQFSKLPKAKKDHAIAKQRLVMACYQFIRERGLKKLAGIALFCEAVNQNVDDSVSVDDTSKTCFGLPAYLRAVIPARHGVQHLNPTSFKRWLYDYEAEGIIALVDDYGKRDGHGKIESNDALKRYVLGFMLRFPFANAVKVKQAIAAQKPELNVVSERSIDRFMNRWKTENAQIWTYITHPDKWKSVYMPAYGSHFEGIDHLNQLWEMDSTPGDWLLTDGRHSVLGVVDLYSRRLSFHVSKTSTGEAVCLAFRKAVLAWGVPKEVRIDNGKDYSSKRFEAVLRDLEIVQTFCIKFASEDKGTIERHLGTTLHGLLELLPGFAGHNVTEAQRIRSMKTFAQRIMTPNEVVEVSMSAVELQTVLDRWATVMYAQDKHAGLQGRTPNQVAALYSGAVRRISDERALDILLAEMAGTRKIKGKKAITLNNYQYIAPELAMYAGKEAVLKYDDADMGRLLVYVENRFVCVAECPELTGISRAEVAVVTKKAIKKQLNEQARELKVFKKEVAEDIPNLVMNHRVENSDNVAFFPRPATEHLTPALEQAAVADRVKRGVPATATIEPAVLAEGKAQVLAFLNSTTEENPIEMNEVQRWRYWNRLHDRQADGGVLSEKELGFYRSFQNSGTFKSFMAVQIDLTQHA
jgi:hypothetical protein